MTATLGHGKGYRNIPYTVVSAIGKERLAGRVVHKDLCVLAYFAASFPGL